MFIVFNRILLTELHDPSGGNRGDGAQGHSRCSVGLPGCCRIRRGRTGEFPFFRVFVPIRAFVGSFERILTCFLFTSPHWQRENNDPLALQNVVITEPFHADHPNVSGCTSTLTFTAADCGGSGESATLPGTLAAAVGTLGSERPDAATRTDLEDSDNDLEEDLYETRDIYTKRSAAALPPDTGATFMIKVSRVRRYTGVAIPVYYG